MKKILSCILIYISLGLILYFSFEIFSYLIEEKASSTISKEIISSAVVLNDSFVKDGTENKEKDDTYNFQMKSPIDIDFDKLKEINSDIIGWIFFENTPINYPVVQSYNNDFYLRRLIDGSYNRAGTIFMDYRNDVYLNDWNTILYGHNMKNDTMFGSLINYRNQSYYDSHKEAYYYTAEKTYRIDLIAGYSETGDSIIYNIQSNQITQQYIIENAIKNSTFESNVDIDKVDNIMIFSTCSYENDDARYVLIGTLNEL